MGKKPINYKRLFDVCLYAKIYAPPEVHDEILVNDLTPLTLELSQEVGVYSVFFIRYADPEHHIRFRVLCDKGEVNPELHERVLERLQEVQGRGLANRIETDTYERELKRYGGEVGMALAERLFDLDSRFCLELLALENQNELSKDRNEIHLMLVDRILDAAGLLSDERSEYYRLFAESFTISETSENVFDEAFGRMRPAIVEFLSAKKDADSVWANLELAACVRGYLAEVRPILAEVKTLVSSGQIDTKFDDLIGSYSHMHANRMGIYLKTEWLLAVFMHRVLAEGS